MVAGACSPVPATLEAEVGGLLGGGRQRLQLVKITPLQFSLGDRVTHCLKKKIFFFSLKRMRLEVRRLEVGRHA